MEKILGIIIVMLIFAGAMYLKLKRPSNGSNTSLPTEPKENDKLILISDVQESELETALHKYFKMYNDGEYNAVIDLSKFGDRDFVITFPFDIDFEYFCYMVNYLYYPEDIKDWKPAVSAWSSLPSGRNLPAGEKGKFFIPQDDTEYDNVYIVVKDNKHFKLPIADYGNKAKEVNITYDYTEPPLEYKDLKGKIMY